MFIIAHNRAIIAPIIAPAGSNGSMSHLGYGKLLRKKCCEPTTPQLEPLFASILKTYTRLKELGFIYFNSIVSMLEMKEDAPE